MPSTQYTVDRFYEYGCLGQCVTDNSDLTLVTIPTGYSAIISHISFSDTDRNGDNVTCWIYPHESPNSNGNQEQMLLYYYPINQNSFDCPEVCKHLTLSQLDEIHTLAHNGLHVTAQVWGMLVPLNQITHPE